MHVNTMTMDPRIALIHYRDYRKKVRAHRASRLIHAKNEITEGNKRRRRAYAEISIIEHEDTILMESYRAMVKGARILNLAAVMRDAGLDKKDRLPLLAIGRADWSRTFLMQNGVDIVFGPTSYTPYLYSKKKYDGDARSFRGIFPGELTNAEWRKQNSLPALTGLSALTPAIPVHLRPEGHLNGYFILWEANWIKRAPDDPLLLKHVAGHIYTVVAQWDLSPLEQAVLEGRIS
jgi:hypothetical protein